MDTNLIDTLREQLLSVQSQLKEQQQLTAAMREREDELLKTKFSNENQSYGNIAEVISEQKRGIILERLNGIQRILQVQILSSFILNFYIYLLTNNCL